MSGGDSVSRQRQTKTAAAKRMEKFEDGFPGEDRDRPWTDADLLEELYWGYRLSMEQISNGWGCSGTTISEWLDRHDIERRSRSESIQNYHGSLRKANLNTSTRGYEYWSPENTMVYVHRLMMVAEHGFGAAVENHVHHKNGIPWDNRFDNLELLSNSEHQQQHLKVPKEDRKRIADMYENTDKSSYTIADEVDYDIVSGTVMEIHGEYYERH